MADNILRQSQLITTYGPGAMIDLPDCSVIVSGLTRTAQGDTIIVRYADDFVVGFQHKRDAEQFLCDLKDRLAAFTLELHPDKTLLIEFGRFADAGRRARGGRRPETFDFLGFTHYCLTGRSGSFVSGRKPIGKRVDRTLKRIKAWPPLKILHPWPEKRFSRHIPEAGAPCVSAHAGICTGGAPGNWRSYRNRRPGGPDDRGGAGAHDNFGTAARPVADVAVSASPRAGGSLEL